MQTIVTKLAYVVFALILVSCSGPPKPTTPPLTPEGAGELLHYNHKAETWLAYIKRQDASCEYRLQLPDQMSHPTQIDIDHLVFCGNRPSPKEYDASVSFAYDPDAQKWVVMRFSS